MYNNLRHKNIILLYLCLAFVSTAISSCGTKKKSKGNNSAVTAPKTNPSSVNMDLVYKNNFYEAIRLKTVGDIEESQKILEWCLKQNPKDDAVLYLLATYAENERRMNKAKDLIQRALTVDPANIWYVEMLAKIQINSDDYIGSEQNFAKMVAYDRYNSEWLYYYSEALIFNKKYAQAIDVLSDLINETGPIPDFVHQRNELYLELKRDEEMLVSLKKLISDYPEMPEFTSMLLGYYNKKKQLDVAEKEFQAILAKQPSHAGARIALADLYRQQRNEAKAHEQVKLAIASKALSDDYAIRLMLNVLNEQNNKNPQLLELGILLRDNYPGNYMSHAILGDIYKENGKPLDALKALEQALKLNGSNYELWLEVVSLYYNMKRYNEALNSAEKALELFPSQPQLYYFAGMSALGNKAYNQALDFLELGKDNIVRDQTLKAQFELATAEVYLAQNNIPKGRKHMEQADYLAPNDMLIQNNRAFLLANYKIDLDKALNIISTIVDRQPNDALFLDTKAWVYYAKKDYDEALNIIKRAHSYAPENTEINEHYGDILYRLGRIDEALVYWIKARELGDQSIKLSKKISSKKIDE